MRIVKTKSIPNVDTARLLDSLAQLHHATHTPDGIRNHTGPRRQLINQGVKIRHIARELANRDQKYPDCRHCLPAPDNFPYSLDRRHNKTA